MILVIALSSCVAIRTNAQNWSFVGTSGPDIYYNAGKVGVGITTPAAPLDIYDNTVAGSGSLNGSILNLAQTWNTTGTPTAIKLNVTSTASSSSSQLMELKVGGTNMFSVSKGGTVITNNLYASYLATSSTVANSNFETYSTTVGIATTSALAGSSNTNARIRIGGSASSVIPANYSMASLLVNNNPVTIGTSGTHPIFANLAVKKLNITAGSATLTNSASLYIEDAATGATRNYAFWSASGTNRFDGSVGIGTITPNADAKLDVTGNIYCSNKIFIGTADNNTPSVTATYALAVNGDAIFNKAKVKLYANWPDYVFAQKYTLTPLKDVEQFILINKHLPDVPTANEIEKNGIDLGDNQAILLKKVEELTLYMIELNKKVEHLETENKLLQKKVEGITTTNN